MPLTIPPGYAQCSIQFRHSDMSRSAFTTWGADFTTAGGDFQGAVNDVRSAWASSLHLQMDNSVTIGPVTARIGQDGGEALVYVDDIAPAVGSITGTVMPPTIAALVHKRTARGGRRGRGRMFIPWILVTSQVDEVGVLTTARVTSLNTALSAFRTALNTNGVPMVLLHGTGQTTPGSPNAVTSLSVDPRVGSQRRRQGR